MKKFINSMKSFTGRVPVTFHWFNEEIQLYHAENSLSVGQQFEFYGFPGNSVFW